MVGEIYMDEVYIKEVNNKLLKKSLFSSRKNILSKAIYKTVENKYIFNNNNLEDLLFNGKTTLDEVANDQLDKILISITGNDIGNKLVKIISRLSLYPYDSTIYRRSFRSNNIELYYSKVLSIIKGVYVDWNQFNLLTFLKMSNKDLKEKHLSKYLDLELLSQLIALEIDENNQDIINAIKDIILSDNNTRIIDRIIILGISKSSNQVLYGLLKDLLLAAKLQEGLRQGILEVADEGRIEYFILMMETMINHDLLRYSSVIRSVNVWMGLGYDYKDKRVVEKVLKNSYKYINNQELAKKAIESNDVLDVYTGLWALSVYQKEIINQEFDKLMSKEKYHKIVALSFFGQINDHKDKNSIIINYLNETDLDVLSLVLANYHIFESYNTKKSFQARCKENLVLSNPQSRDQQFKMMVEIIKLIPKKGYQYSYTLFPWISTNIQRANIYYNLCIIVGYDYDSKKIDKLIELDEYGDSSNKIMFIENLLDINKYRSYLFSCLKDKSMTVRKAIVKKIKSYKLSQDELLMIEDMLALKTGTIRQDVIDIINNDNRRIEVIERLLISNNENKVLAGLNLMELEVKKNNYSIDKANNLISQIKKITDNQKILINNILAGKIEEYNKDNGLGLYDLDKQFPNIDVSDYGKGSLASYKNINETVMISAIKSLENIIDKNKNFTYKRSVYNGEEEIHLGEALYISPTCNIGYFDLKNSSLDDYILIDIWRSWLVDNQVPLPLLIKIAYAGSLHWGYHEYSVDMHFRPFKFTKSIKNTLGESDIRAVHQYYKVGNYVPLAVSIITLLIKQFSDEEVFKYCHGMLYDLVKEISFLSWQEKSRRNEYTGEHYDYLINQSEISYWIDMLKESSKDNDFEQELAMLIELNKKSNSKFIHFNETIIAKAVTLKIFNKDILYQYFLQENARWLIEKYTKNKIENYEYSIIKEVVDSLVQRIIDIEVVRGDTPTDVSKIALGIKCHHGIDNFVNIILALGKEPLVRTSFIYADTKKDVFSSLLKASKPNIDDNLEKLKAVIQGRISEKRLLEAAMYAPAWVTIIKDYLGWEGLESTIWYFHGHTNKSIDEEYVSDLSRFTPIPKEELQDGAFDINWFKEAYESIDSKRFDILYECAKYISENGSYRRAQLFADATLGKLVIEEVEQKIPDKRNKDLLRTYPLIPLKEDIFLDALNRYEFIQRFLKESKKFGAQRRESEAKVVKVALGNLARNLGYPDVLRLTWKMEILVGEELSKYFNPYKVDEYYCYIGIDEKAKADIIILKDDKQIKTIPTKLKKNIYIEELKKVKTTFKAQLSRSRISLENAMKNQESFTFKEVKELLSHPVLRIIINKLIFKTDNGIGFLDENGLIFEDNKILLNDDALLTIAHSYDLYQSKQWSKLQRYAFDHQLIQPFKQIFRELYTINDDEKQERTLSRRYAGYQVQPNKTLALLKNQNWVVDESGLQKIYYQENIIVRLYSYASWFTPAEIEAPTLEEIRFYDRRTNEPIELKEISPIIFSETMRDIDLVVSVANVGGVDVEASLSTIEMRQVIVTGIINMLKLSNATIDGNFVKIKGSLQEYSVHLGSGIVHMMTKGVLNILAVHSQHRGKIFLPFIDEDPKTAEITTKVLMLANDQKLKDPSILSQIVG